MQLSNLIQTIHDTTGMSVIVTAGAGAVALAEIFAVAGASRTVLEARIPYSASAFVDFIGQTPAQFVSADAARRLAGRALTHAQLLITDDQPLVGIGCTATIATDRPKRGEHRVHLAAWRNEEVVTYSLQFVKNARTRAGEEQIVSRLLINALAHALDIDQQLALDLLDDEMLQTQRSDLAAAVAALLNGEQPFVAVHADGRIAGSHVNPQLLLSGSFNPLHKGHLALAEHAARTLAKPVAFEIPVLNADKPALSQKQALKRLAQFAGRWPVYLTNAGTFVDKARLFPDTDFVVGYDTAVRILQPRFYDNSLDQMQQALRAIDRQRCRFVVAGRALDSHYRTVADMAVPVEWAHLFVPLPDFRYDISSTQLRAQGQAGSR